MDICLIKLAEVSGCVELDVVRKEHIHSFPVPALTGDTGSALHIQQCCAEIHRVADISQAEILNPDFLVVAMNKTSS